MPAVNLAGQIQAGDGHADEVAFHAGREEEMEVPAAGAQGVLEHLNQSPLEQAAVFPPKARDLTGGRRPAPAEQLLVLTVLTTALQLFRLEGPRAIGIGQQAEE